MVSLAEAIDLLIRNAAQLRAAGVESVTADGFHCTLAKYVEPTTNAGPERAAESAGGTGRRDPLYDNATFGGASVGYELDKD